MPLDHYVPQVHLRRFYDPATNRLTGFKKSDLKSFLCKSADVCRIESWNTNHFLAEPRAAEALLKEVEPRYNSSVAKIIGGSIDHDAIFTIAGFVASILVTSPTGARIQSAPLHADVVSAIQKLERQGKLPAVPLELGGGSLVELVRDGRVEIDIDQAYPRAIGTTLLISMINSFGNGHWEVLHGPSDDDVFFTSDYPIAVEKKARSVVDHRVVPLTPTLAVRIIPREIRPNSRTELDFSEFSFRSRKLRSSEVLEINRKLVRCAEETVFYRGRPPWLERFVAANRSFRLETKMDTIEMDDGNLRIARQQIVRYHNLSAGPSRDAPPRGSSADI